MLVATSPDGNSECGYTKATSDTSTSLKKHFYQGGQSTPELAVLVKSREFIARIFRIERSVRILDRSVIIPSKNIFTYHDIVAIFS